MSAVHQSDSSHSSRRLTVAAAQSGPVFREETRTEVVDRRIGQLREAAQLGAELVVFPECALTAFFPHWTIDSADELDAWFEMEMPGPVTQPLFDEARRLGVGFHLGYAELAQTPAGKKRYNSAILVGPDGQTIGRFRKIHLPGYREPRPEEPFQNLEKRYFDVGDQGFPAWRAFGGIVGMCICNDRRWPETWRVLGLQGTELALVGYNTPLQIPGQPQMEHLVSFHNQLCLQAGAWQNGMWIVAVAKAGTEEGVPQLGQSAIIAPSGEIVAMAATIEDEVIVRQIDLEATRPWKEFMFNFAANRKVEHYGLITERTAAGPPLGE